MNTNYPTLTRGLARRTTIDQAEQAFAQVRSSIGLSAKAPPLLTPPHGNTKLNKTQQWGLSLLPHRLSGKNVCPFSTKGCRSVCLVSSGRGAASNVHEARLARTRFLFEHSAEFATLLEREIMDLPADSALRLNVFSDLPWEIIWPDVFNLRSDLQFYDYTKWPVGSRVTPPNYHLTYSASENWSDEDVIDVVGSGQNVTVVFRLRPSEDIPSTWNGLPTVDGDKSDARYEDPVGVVVGLRMKGKARKSTSKFIREAVPV